MATFGYLNEGTNWVDFLQGVISGYHAAPADGDGTLTKISAYMKNTGAATKKATALLYAYVGAGDAGTKLATSTEIDIPVSAAAWRDFPISYAVVDATQYWLLVSSDGGNTVSLAYDTGGSAGIGLYKDITYGVFEDPLTGETPSTAMRSIYATYTSGVNGSISNVSLISLGLGAWLATQKKKKRMKKSVLAKKIARDAMKPMVKYLKKVDEAIKKAV